MNGLTSRRTLIYLALSLMTACWITTVLQGFWGAAQAPPPLIVVLLTLLTLVPLGLSRWLRRLELRPELRRALLAGAFLFLCLLVLSSGFNRGTGSSGGGWLEQLREEELLSSAALNRIIAVALVALSWWLGVTLGDMPLTSSNLLRYFYVCLLALALPSIFFLSDVSQDLPWLYFTFLFAGLMTLGLGRVEEAARRSQDRGSPFTFYWLTQIGLVAGALLALVALAQALKLAYGFGLILAVVAPLLSLLIFPVVYLGAKILVWSGFRIMAPVSDGAEQNAAGATAQVAQPSAAGSLCTGLVALVVFLTIVVLIVYGTRRWRALLKEQEREERGALPSLGDRVSEALEERLERLGTRLPGMDRLRRRLAARSIRRIYAALTALGAQCGYPRPAARTPYEHLSALRRAFPGCEAQVQQITEAYVAAHYGEAPETREALRAIRAAWEQVHERARHSASPPGQGVADLHESGRV
jgi:hypothetical protein